MANNVNNGITGVIDIPGALRSRGAADGSQVGGVVAYAGDIYDTQFSDGVNTGMNQAAINAYLKTNSGTDYTHPASHPASMITYNASTEYESGNVGYEIKRLVTSLSAKYAKPGTGIPETDLASDVQTSLGYADDYNTNKSSFVTSTALETALTGLSPYSAGTGISITTVSGGKQIAVDTAVYKVKDVQNASGTSLVTSGIATIPITSIKDSGGNDLTVANGAVTLPAIPASDIGYNNALSNLTANNIQEAIDLLAANVSDNLTTLNITLIYSNGTAITNKAVSVNISFRGESHSTTGVYTTDSSGLISLSIPYGSIYSIGYNDINNYQTPEPVSGSADMYTVNINGIYQPVSNTEKVIVTCSIRNGTSSPNGKKVYIDIYDSTGTTLITEKAFTVTLNSQGLASTIIDSNNQTASSCEVPNGNVYRVYAQPWDDTENPPYSVTGQQSFLASKYSRIVHFDYTYLNSGIFLMINNPQNSTDGYDSLKVKEIDDTNNTICIIDNNDEYWVYYESGVGIKRYLNNSSIENSYLWIEDSDINNKVLGIGFRNQTLNVASNSNSAISGTCAFCMLFSSSVQSAAEMWESGATIAQTSSIDGLYTTELYKDTDHPTFAIALNYTSFKTQIGTRNQQAFIMATNQFLVLYNNFSTVKVVCNAVNRVFDFMNANSNYWTSTCTNVGIYNAQNSSGSAYYFNNSSKTLVNEPTGTSGKYFALNTYKTFPVYSY